MPKVRVNRLDLTEINRAIVGLDDDIERVAELLDQLRSGKIAFTGDVDLGGFRATNAGTSESEDDLLTGAELANRIDDIEDEEVALETSEAEDYGGGAKARRKARRTSRLKSFAEDAALGALADAVPTVAPPEVEDAGALGTTDDSPGPVLFALSDHTHSGVNLGDAQTITGAKTFDLDPAAPFIVTAGSAKVANLDVDLLDGLDSTQFLRSDTSDAFTSGTLTINAGTTLSVAGTFQATETGGPTLLTLAGVADLEVLTRSGTDIAGRILFPFFNGTFQETFDATVTSDGVTITLSLEQTGTGDLTMQFSDGTTTLDCTPPQTIALTAGTDSSPQENYIYVLQSTKALTKSTSAWPSAEHIKVAFLFVPSAGFVQTDGPYVNQNWNDHLQGTDSQGHMAHMAERSRRLGPVWFSGVDPNGATASYFTISAGNTEFISTAGVIYQMHQQAFAAIDTSGGSKLLVKNWSGDPYHDITDLFSITADSTGTTITNNRYFNLVFWGVANKTGEYSTVLVNLPGGFYVLQSDAENDTNSYDDFVIPREFSLDSSTGFLIARSTFQMGATWTHVSTIDLRGRTPTTASGSVGNVHNLLSSTHSDTTASSPPTRGSLIVADSTPVWTELGVGSGADLLQVDGSSDPQWITMSNDATIAVGGALTLANTAVTPGTYGDATNVAQVTVDSKGRLTAAANVPITGVPPAAHNILSASHGDTTGAGTEAQGDILYRNATTQWTNLAANATATNLFLRSVSGGIPAWAQVAHTDLSGVTANQHHNQSHVLATNLALGPDHTMSGAAAGQVLRASGATTANFQALAASDITSGAALTRVNDTNVTLTLGGSPSTALLAATSLTLGWTGQLAVGRGGTGLASGTSGGILGFTGATTLASSGVLTNDVLVVGGGAGATPNTIATGLGTTTTVLHGNAAGEPTWGAVSLTADVTGVLPVANGGTNASSWTAGSVVFAGAGGTSLTQDNTNLFWDDTNNRLGISVTTPQAPLHIRQGTSGGLPAFLVSPGLLLQSNQTAANAPWFTIISGTSGTSTISFGDSTSDFLANITYLGSTGSLSLGAASGPIILAPGSNRIDVSGTSASLSLSSSGSGTLYGAEAASQNLTLRSTRHATAGEIQLNDVVTVFDSYTGAANADFITIDPTATIGTRTLRGLYFNPTATVNNLGTAVFAIAGAGTYTQTGSAILSAFQLFSATPILTSATAATPPMDSTIFNDNATVRSTGSAAAGTVGFHYGLYFHPDMSSIDTSSMTVTALTGHLDAPRIVSASSGNITVSTRRALYIQDVTKTGAGTETLTNNIGIDLDDLTAGGTLNLSLRSAGSAVEMRHAGPIVVGSFSTSSTELLDVLAGNVYIAGGSSTGYIDIGEYNGSSDAGAPSDNRARLYVRDNGAGKEQMVVRFNTGAVQVLATEP